MTVVADRVWSHLEQFCSGDLPVADFEAWLYAHVEEVETVLGARGRELIEHDFRGKHGLRQAKELVEQAYETARPGELVRDQARRALTEYLAGSRDLWSLASTLARLRFELPEGVIPDEFVYIDSELDGIPHPSQEGQWDATEWQRMRSEKASVLAAYERAAKEVGRHLLRRLESPTWRVA